MRNVGVQNALIHQLLTSFSIKLRHNEPVFTKLLITHDLLIKRILFLENIKTSFHLSAILIFSR